MKVPDAAQPKTPSLAGSTGTSPPSQPPLVPDYELVSRIGIGAYGEVWLARGILGTFDLSWSITKDSKNYIQVFGSEGTLQVGWKGSRYCQDGSSKWIPFGTGYDKTTSFANQHACVS